MSIVFTYTILQFAKALQCVKVLSLFAEHSTRNFAFHKLCETFIQPEMLVVGICHQIASPAVRNFMRYNRCKRFITSLK